VKTCPRGAIVRHDELALLYDATVHADRLRLLVASERHLKTPGDREQRRHDRELILDLKHIQEKIRGIGLLHRKAQERGRAAQ
jgi:hypothetical protein